MNHFDQSIEDMLAQINGVEYGSVNFEVKKYDNRVVGMVTNREVSYKPRDNAAGGAYILQQINDDIKAKYRGTRTFSVVYDGNGGIKRIIRQDYDSKNYES